MSQGGMGNRMGPTGMQPLDSGGGNRFRQQVGTQGGYGLPDTRAISDPISSFRTGQQFTTSQGNMTPELQAALDQQRNSWTLGQNGFNRNGPIPPGTMTPELQNALTQNQNAWTPGQNGFDRFGPIPPGGRNPTQDRAISDPYRDFGGPAIQNQPSQGFQPYNSAPLTQTTTQAPGGVMGADGRMYAGRDASPRAYTGGAFNPAANQWGDYSQAVGDGLWGTDAQGINRVNGHVFAPSGLTSGNTDFANWMNRFAPQYAQQNGPINRGQAYVGAPGIPSAPSAPGALGVMQGSGTLPGTSNGLGRGAGPQFDPRRGIPNADPFGRNANPFLKRY